MKLPQSLSDLLKDKKKNEDTYCKKQQCKTCTIYLNDMCCTRPGFAIFENTLKIYEKYKEQYSYKDFIEKYFNIEFYYDNLSLILFYPKVNAKPPGGKASNGGCVFLKRILTGEPGEQFMNCSLYDEKSFEEITTWPLGCVTDSTQIGDGYKRFWEYRLSIINYYFPQSTKKFFEKINNTTMTDEQSFYLAQKQYKMLKKNNKNEILKDLHNGVFN
jgi:hypothetical protein